MSMTILFVDDEPNILAGYQRQLRKLFTIETATSGAEALERIHKDGPFAVIVTDMQMPEMNGVALLKEAARIAPQTVRIMLTGNADQQTATDALNEGQIFRFLTKPCLPETMVQALQAGLSQYKLIAAEKELLEKTLIGSISILIDVLTISDPQIFDRGKRLRDCVREVVDSLDYRNRWELEMAALLSQIGNLTIPPEILLKERAGLPLSAEETDFLARVPESGCNLLAKIPRMETVAQIIRYQAKLYNGGGIPTDAISGEAIPLGSRILRVLSDLMELEAGGAQRSVAFRQMWSRNGWYDPLVLETINACYLPPVQNLKLKSQSAGTKGGRKINPEILAAWQAHSKEAEEGLAITFADLMVGDILAADLKSADDSLLLHRGSLITEAILEKLKNYVHFKGAKEPVMVVVSEEEKQAA